MKENPDVQRQARFGSDGEMEVDEEVDTDLTDWEIVEVEQEVETKYMKEAASEFGVDDRSEVEKSESEQGELFIDAGEDQMTLDGEEAERQPAWGDD